MLIAIKNHMEVIVGQMEIDHGSVVLSTEYSGTTTISSLTT